MFPTLHNMLDMKYWQRGYLIIIDIIDVSGCPGEYNNRLKKLVAKED